MICSYTYNNFSEGWFGGFWAIFPERLDPNCKVKRAISHIKNCWSAFARIAQYPIFCINRYNTSKSVCRNKSNEKRNKGVKSSFLTHIVQWAIRIQTIFSRYGKQILKKGSSMAHALRKTFPDSFYHHVAMSTKLSSKANLTGRNFLKVLSPHTS